MLNKHTALAVWIYSNNKISKCHFKAYEYFQHYSVLNGQNSLAIYHKARTIKEFFSESGLEELDVPAQSPDVKAIKHL